MMQIEDDTFYLIVETLAMRAALECDEGLKYVDEPKPRTTPKRDPSEFFLERSLPHRIFIVEDLIDERTLLIRGKNAGYFLGKYEWETAKKIMEIPVDNEFMKGFAEAYNAYQKERQERKWRT